MMFLVRSSLILILAATSGGCDFGRLRHPIRGNSRSRRRSNKDHDQSRRRLRLRPRREYSREQHQRS
jgi:hypothetical protein